MGNSLSRDEFWSLGDRERSPRDLECGELPCCTACLGPPKGSTCTVSTWPMQEPCRQAVRPARVGDLRLRLCVWIEQLPNRANRLQPLRECLHSALPLPWTLEFRKMRVLGSPLPSHAWHNPPYTPSPTPTPGHPPWAKHTVLAKMTKSKNCGARGG